MKIISVSIALVIPFLIVVRFYQHFIRIQSIGFDALSQIRQIRLFDLIPLVLIPLVILPLEFLRRCSVAFIIFLILCYGICRVQDLQFPVMNIDF